MLLFLTSATCTGAHVSGYFNKRISLSFIEFDTDDDMAPVFCISIPMRLGAVHLLKCRQYTTKTCLSFNINSFLKKYNILVSKHSFSLHFFNISELAI